MLEETREADGEAEVRERMQLLNSQLVDFISNLHEVFTSQIFIAICRGLWDRMGQVRVYNYSTSKMLYVTCYLCVVLTLLALTFSSNVF
jgi:hypothetical protein